MGFGVFPYLATETCTDSSQAVTVAPPSLQAFSSLPAQASSPLACLALPDDRFGSFRPVPACSTGLGRARRHPGPGPGPRPCRLCRVSHCSSALRLSRLLLASILNPSRRRHGFLPCIFIPNDPPMGNSSPSCESVTALSHGGSL